MWKSTSVSGAFSAMTRPSWLGRAVRNRHRHAIEQASRRWRGGRTRRKIVISTQVAADESAQDEMAAHLKKVDKGALEQGADFYKATAVEEAKATRVPRILEDDEDQRKQLVRDVATCLKCAERPFVLGSLPDACTYDPGTLAARCGAVAARLVVEQALPQEQDAVFELLRRRTAVVHDPNREDDTKVKPTSGLFVRRVGEALPDGGQVPVLPRLVSIE